MQLSKIVQTICRYRIKKVKKTQNKTKSVVKLVVDTLLAGYLPRWFTVYLHVQELTGLR